MIDRRLGRAECGQDRLGAGGGLGEGHEAAIVQLQRRRMGKLAGVPEAAHQWPRSAGNVGSESMRRIAAQRAAGSAPARSIAAATMSRPRP